MDIVDDDDPSAPRLSLNKSIVAGCQSVTGRLLLANPAPAGGRVVSISDTLTSATTPASVTVPAGATTTTFSIKTTPVTTLQSGTITANFGGTVLTRKLSVRRIGMLSVELDRTTVVGTKPVAATAKLECKAAPGPITVNLASSNAAIADPVAASIVVPQGLQSVPFDVATSKVLSTANRFHFRHRKRHQEVQDIDSDPGFVRKSNQPHVRNCASWRDRRPTRRDAHQQRQDVVHCWEHRHYGHSSCVVRDDGELPANTGSRRIVQHQCEIQTDRGE